MSTLVRVFIFFVYAFSVNALELKGDIIVFKDKAEAARHALGSVWSMVPPEFQKADYIKADAIANSLRPAFCKRFPDCEKFPPPEIILSYTSGSTTFGMEHDGKMRQTNVIIIPNELIHSPKDLEFVLAHEMVHYYEKHALTNSLHDEIYHIHRQVFGNCQEFSYPIEEVREDLIDLMSLIDHIGHKAHMVSAYNGLPLDGILGEVLQKMIIQTQHYSKQCSELYGKFRSLQNRVNQGNYLHGGDPAVNKFMGDAHECFEKYEGNLLKEVMKDIPFGNSNEELETQLRFQAIIDRDSPELARLISLRNESFDKYSTLSRKLSAPQLRYHSEEDIADITAVEILLKDGKENLLDYMNYLLAELSTTQQIRCKDDLEKGREPDYGPLNRPHHSECWRIWRALQMEKTYKETLAKEKSDKNNQETSRQ